MKPLFFCAGLVLPIASHAATLPVFSVGSGVELAVTSLDYLGPDEDELDNPKFSGWTDDGYDRTATSGNGTASFGLSLSQSSRQNLNQSFSYDGGVTTGTGASDVDFYGDRVGAIFGTVCTAVPCDAYWQLTFSYSLTAAAKVEAGATANAASTLYVGTGGYGSTDVFYFEAAADVAGDLAQTSEKSGTFTAILEQGETISIWAVNTLEAQAARQTLSGPGTVPLASAPLPSSAALLLAGLGGVVLLRRRRVQSA